MITMSYYGADKVVENYNMMGPVKSALESCARYLASELGRKGIRVHAISPGPLKTRAASGIDETAKYVGRFPFSLYRMDLLSILFSTIIFIGCYSLTLRDFLDGGRKGFLLASDQ